MLLWSSAIDGQNPKAYEVISPATYETVLDIAFACDKPRQDYDLVLRFEPSNAPESQIYIKRTPTKTEVIEYTSLSGNIYLKLSNIVRDGGKEDAAELAKQIQVKKRALDVPAAQASKWLDRLPDVTASTMKLLERRRAGELKGVGTITIDGTRYSFSYKQVESSGGAEMWDDEISDSKVTGQFALVRWMNSVRLDVAKLK